MREVVASVLISVLAGLPATAHPSQFTEMLGRIPDLTQTDPSAGFEGDGRKFCAPVALSNAIIGLAHQGHTGLFDYSGDEYADQIRLVKVLAGQRYLKAEDQDGSSAQDFLSGVERYLADRGVRYSSLKFQGWRYCDPRYRTASELPDLDWIKDELSSGGAVVLNIGFYYYDDASKSYTRHSGHWITLAGYGVDAKGMASPGCLIVHDPAARAGTNPNQFAIFQPIAQGTLLGKNKGLPRDATGLLRATGGIAGKKASVTILDGVVSLRL